MKIELELSDNIYNAIKDDANELGVAIEELLRVRIGQMFYTPVVKLPTDIPVPMQGLSDSAKELLGLSEMMIQSVITQGAIKCPHCTLPIDFESFKSNKCSNCQMTLFGKTRKD